MSGSGGGQTQTVSNELPAWLQDAAKENLARAGYVSQIGPVEYAGPDVAAFTPMQQQVMQNQVGAAQAFGMAPAGMNAMAGMPQAQNFGGVMGYSSQPVLSQAKQALQQSAPAQYDAITGMFIDPMTGEAGVAFTPAGSIAMPSAGAGAQAAVGGSGGDDMSFHGGFDSSMANSPLGGPLDYLGAKYNQLGGKMFLSPIAGSAGFLADKLMQSQGYEYGKHGYHDPTVTNTTPAMIQDAYMAEAYGGGSGGYQGGLASSASRQSSKLDSGTGSGIGSGGGNASRGFSTGGW